MKKEDVDEMSLQEACDYAVGKLVEQGIPCMVGGGCRYRDSSRTMHCAVGWLLDETNERLMNSVGGVYTILYRHGKEMPKLIAKNLEIFLLLQRFHDYPNKNSRQTTLTLMSKHIDISNVIYRQWVNMGSDGWR